MMRIVGASTTGVLLCALTVLGCGGSAPGTHDTRSDSARDSGADVGQADTAVDQGSDLGVDTSRDGRSPDGRSHDGTVAVADKSLPLPDTRHDVWPDLPPAADAGPPPDAGASHLREYVADSLLMPSNPAEAALYGYDYDNNGTQDNALGAILSALAGAFPGVSFSDQASLAVAQGSTLALLRVDATSFLNHSGTTASFWWASPVACCSSTVLSVCRAQAATTCFDGSKSFTPIGAATALGGSITAAVGTLTAPSLPLRLVLGGTPIEVTLSSARVSGRFAGNGIVAGKISGGLSKTEVDTKLIPAVAVMIDAIVKNPLTTAGTRAQLLALFDTDGNGTVTTAEVAGNTLIQTFFAGDVDVDSDGRLDLSLGMGFTAVGCVIQ